MSDFTTILGGSVEEEQEIVDSLRRASEGQPWSPFGLLQFENVQFDFQIDPDHFIRWLNAEGEGKEDTYQRSVAGMCEYSCLYIAMMLHSKKLQSEPVVYYGKFGFWEHFWIGYTFNGQEYFLDFTLQQFVEDAPRFAVIKPINYHNVYNFIDDGEHETISQYLDRQRAFMFYRNPKDIV